MSIMREKVMALLEEVESSADIIDTNITSWESRKLDRDNGAFSTDEVTDPGNIDRNRINHELPMNVSDHNADTDPNKRVAATGMEAIMIGVSESKFAQDIRKVLQEQDWEGVKAWNPDLRIAAYQVKRALDSACPGVKGIQVVEDVTGALGEGTIFEVQGGVDWNQYGKDQQLPKLLDVENVQLKLEEDPEGVDNGVDVPAAKKYIYRVVGANSKFPIPTDEAL